MEFLQFLLGMVVVTVVPVGLIIGGITWSNSRHRRRVERMLRRMNLLSGPDQTPRHKGFPVAWHAETMKLQMGTTLPKDFELTPSSFQKVFESFDADLVSQLGGPHLREGLRSLLGYGAIRQGTLTASVQAGTDDTTLGQLLDLMAWVAERFRAKQQLTTEQRLFEMARSDPDPEPRRAASRLWIARLGPEGVRERWADVQQLLNSTDPLVRCHAAAIVDPFPGAMVFEVAHDGALSMADRAYALRVLVERASELHEEDVLPNIIPLIRSVRGQALKLTLQLAEAFGTAPSLRVIVNRFWSVSLEDQWVLMSALEWVTGNKPDPLATKLLRRVEGDKEFPVEWRRRATGILEQMRGVQGAGALALIDQEPVGGLSEVAEEGHLSEAVEH